MYKLCKREPPAILRAAHIQTRARRVQQRANKLEEHRVHRQPRDLRHDSVAAHEYNGANRRRE